MHCYHPPLTIDSIHSRYELTLLITNTNQITFVILFHDSVLLVVVVVIN